MNLKNILNYIFSITKTKSHIIYRMLGVKIKIKLKQKEDCIVLIEPAGIGDYLCCRQYFKYIKKSKKYENCKIVYITRFIYEDIAKIYDYNIFDRVIPYSKADKSSLKAILLLLNHYKVLSVINLWSLTENNNTEPKIDKLVKKIKTKERNIEYINLLNKKHNNSILKDYNIIRREKPVFEIEGRRLFFEKVLELDLPYEENKLDIIFNNNNLPSYICENKKYIAISMIGMNPTKMIKIEHWKKIIDYILNNTNKNFNILFLGSKNDKEYINNFIEEYYKDNTRTINTAGDIPISVLPTLLNNCEFLVGVETGTIHFAKAVGLNAICLSSGQYYRRCQPYKNSCITYIYPETYKNYIKNNNEENLLKIYNNTDLFNINDIDINEVINKIDQMINK